MIANYDALFSIPIGKLQLLCSYYIVAAIFIVISVYHHIKQNKNERKVKNIKSSS